MTTRATPVQALILAAGKGTRLKSPLPKVLHEAAGAPLLEGPLRAVRAAGAEPVTVVVGHGADAVEAAFAGRARFVLQDPPLGTGHAVLVARAAIAEHPGTLLVVNGDLPLLRKETIEAVLERHLSGAAATLLTAQLADPGAYGRVLRDDHGRVRAVVEAKDASAEERRVGEINAGLYAFETEPLLEALDRLEAGNAQGEYYLTDVVARLVERGLPVLALPAEDPEETLGVNTFEELATAHRALVARRLRELMLAGVAIEDPASTSVSLHARVEPGARIRPFTFLEGRTHIERGAVVGPFVRLENTTVGEEAQVLDHCLLRDTIVEAGATIGPFAHLRPESRVGRRAKVGNFVELKKTELGEGAKAPHLSYLGDATVGPGANVGAGTITCNYDGAAKHRTTIGARAFIGSDSTLVAPVRVGDGAYVAAGSTITEDVPADALALGRARQVLKPGWAKARRDRDDASKRHG
ncbi:MAG TPA: bifunctional UDP-N-acetylglucosamine diphosphorylase/glucosamine-1-phosphate N-acetyltransferase GlmU [Vicinamibacteria bacterium]|nr:bifunctional UDP-N-acetylglucosamine diphosphorylase/glucosamine-1-phosphate N-acetyltransferase GlmU [Vicinamibacteria bacterium]